jgi:putative ABC transport system permease protein
VERVAVERVAAARAAAVPGVRARAEAPEMAPIPPRDPSLARPALGALLPEILSVAVTAIAANKLRSLLTMLGVIIGVGAVITMVALGEGARRAVEARIESLGTDVLTVMSGQRQRMGASREGEPLTVDDAAAILERSPSVIDIAPEMSASVQIEFLTRNTPSQALGTTPSYLKVNRFELAAGRFITDEDMEARRRVAVLGAELLTSLNVSAGEILGQTIRLRGLTFEVVGILARKGQQGWMNPDDQVLIPLTTAQYRVSGDDRLRAVNVQMAPGANPADAMLEIERVVRREHRLRADQPSDFRIRNRSDLLATAEDTTRTLSFLLASVAGVSLLVGGIGIMNIMLVSVTERTREIGVRMAIGATRTIILLQFLIEALTICVIGGVAGILLGAGASLLLSKLAGWNTLLSPQAVVVAFLFSIAVGLFFGIVPARRAASLDPIDALRYE